MGVGGGVTHMPINYEHWGNGSSSNVLVVLWFCFCFVNFTQARLIREERTLTEKMPPTDWPLDNLWGIFLMRLKWETSTYCERCHHWASSPRFIKTKQTTRANHGEQANKCYSMVSASRNFSSCLHVPPHPARPPSLNDPLLSRSL